MIAAIRNGYFQQAYRAIGSKISALRARIPGSFVPPEDQGYLLGAIILPDADFARAVKGGVRLAMFNSGQACNGPTRMLIPRQHQQEIEEIVIKATEGIVVGNPRDDKTYMGPIANRAQYERVLTFIQRDCNYLQALEGEIDHRDVFLSEHEKREKEAKKKVRLRMIGPPRLPPMRASPATPGSGHDE